ncbi:MAG: protein translocase subunit SecD [Rhizomicrobium sp.]
MIYSRWQIVLIAVACLLGVLFALPNAVSDRVLGYLPFEQRVHLGLDLRGGSYLLLKVDTAAAERERAQSIMDGVRRTLRKARISYENLQVQNGVIAFHLRDAGRATEVPALLQPVVGTGIGGDYELTKDTDGRFAFKPLESGMRTRASDAVDRSIEIIRRRIDETGVNEPTIARQGEDRIAVQLPGVNDPERVKRLLGTTAKMSFHLVSEAGTSDVGDVMILPGLDKQDAQRYAVLRRVDVDGAHLRNARAATNSQTGQWVVNFQFDSVGARQFADTTKNNVDRRFAVVLDNRVITAPVIREPILGGQGEISGNFTAASANDLAILLRGGALPAPLNIIEEKTVGPNLGADAIRTGAYACLIGGALVVMFMLFFYRLFGVFASIGLAINLCFLIGILSLLQASLTLPGIVGILLTVGMSVDANVLINERIREEARKGRGPVSAIQTGFKKAMSTIVDANATTLLKMLILFLLTEGTVKGFAVTISIGILTSLFTAVVLVRLLMALWLRQARPKALLA